jgi:hypothetical protein
VLVHVRPPHSHHPLQGLQWLGYNSLRDPSLILHHSLSSSEHHIQGLLSWALWGFCIDLLNSTQKSPHFRDSRTWWRCHSAVLCIVVPKILKPAENWIWDCRSHRSQQ